MSYVTYFSSLMNVARHDPDFTFSWLNDSRAIGSKQARLVLRLERLGNLQGNRLIDDVEIVIP